MPGTTTFDRGAVVLVKFVFADEKGAKKRPVLVLSTRRYHAGRREVIVAAITSRVERSLVGDHRIVAWRQAGLPRPSVVTGILRTVERTAVEGPAHESQDRVGIDLAGLRAQRERRDPAVGRVDDQRCPGGRSIGILEPVLRSGLVARRAVVLVVPGQPLLVAGASRELLGRQLGPLSEPFRPLHRHAALRVGRVDALQVRIAPRGAGNLRRRRRRQHAACQHAHAHCRPESISHLRATLPTGQWSVNRLHLEDRALGCVLALRDMIAGIRNPVSLEEVVTCGVSGWRVRSP